MSPKDIIDCGNTRLGGGVWGCNGGFPIYASKYVSLYGLPYCALSGGRPCAGGCHPTITPDVQQRTDYSGCTRACVNGGMCSCHLWCDAVMCDV